VGKEKIFVKKSQLEKFSERCSETGGNASLAWAMNAPGCS